MSFWRGPRVWGLAVAAGVAAGSWAVQIGAGIQDGRLALLAALRTALGATWLTVVLIILVQEARVLARASTDAPAAAGAAGAAVRDDKHVSRPTAPWATVVRRAVLVSTVTLPRFLTDPAGHLVAAWWLVILLVCGYAYAEPMLRGRRAAAYWIAAAVFLLPWGVRAVPVRWPPFG